MLPLSVARLSITARISFFHSCFFSGVGDMSVIVLPPQIISNALRRADVQEAK